jgi:hypothetical protein
MSGRLAPMEGRRRRGVLPLVGATLLLFGTVGVLHTRPGRPLLAALGLGCPALRATPADVEALRQRALAGLRGATPAASRPALGLQLDVSTEANVRAWAVGRSLSCEGFARPTRHFTCHDVAAEALAETGAHVAADEVTFTFFPDGRLLGVETFRRRLEPDAATRAFIAITTSLDVTVGPSTERAGAPDAAYLEEGFMHTAFARYRYADYLASVTAMNISGRIALREQYLSARAPG